MQRVAWDGDSIRKEGDALLAQLNERLNGWRTNMEQNLTSSLSHYFDPSRACLPSGWSAWCVTMVTWPGS